MDTPQYDEFFPAAFHDLEKRAMAGERKAILDLIDAERKLRNATRVLMSHRYDYGDGWFEDHYWDAFESQIKDALTLSEEYQ